MRTHVGYTTSYVPKFKSHKQEADTKKPEFETENETRLVVESVERIQARTRKACEGIVGGPVDAYLK